MSHDTQAGVLSDPAAILRAAGEAFGKLDPRRMILSPVMFTIEVGAVLISALAVARAAGQPGTEHPAFIAAVAVGLWATVLFANFAEAMAEGRGRAQADAMRRTRGDTLAKRLAAPRHDAAIEGTPSTQLRCGDHVLIEAGDIVPGDGEVIDGVASVDESAITGESAPVIRESGGDRNTVTGGTRILSDWLVVRITANPGESFLDKMISMVEGAKRQKTPNEIALDILLAGLTLVFLVVTATLLPFSMYAVSAAGRGRAGDCLEPGRCRRTPPRPGRNLRHVDTAVARCRTTVGAIMLSLSAPNNDSRHQDPKPMRMLPFP